MTPEYRKRKTLEISHGVFRIADRVREAHLKYELYLASVALVREETNGDFVGALKSLELMQTFVLFGETVGEIAYTDSRVLYREFEILKSGLQVVLDTEAKKFDLESLFSVLPDESGNTENNAAVSQITLTPSVEQEKEEIKKVSTQDRLQLITKRVHELGHAAMRDIIAAFPEVSERTLRYDPQKLCEQGVLERVGTGGPASYYKARDVIEV